MRPATTSLLNSPPHSTRRRRCSSPPTDQSSTVRCTSNSGQTITLQPLTDSTAVRLVGQLLGNDPSLAGLAERIAVAAAGNPFFVEEIVRDLAGRGVLSGSRGRYRLIGRCRRDRRPGHGAGGARGPHRSAARRSEVDPERRGGYRQPNSTWNAAGSATGHRTVSLGRAGVGGVDRSDGIRSATTLLLPSSAGAHGRLRITVERHPRCRPTSRLAAAIEARDPSRGRRERGADRHSSGGGRRTRRRPTAGTCARRNGFGLAIFPPHARSGRAHDASPTDYPMTTTTSSPCASRRAPC